MKITRVSFLTIALLFISCGANASVTIVLQVGKLTDSQATDLPADTLWALIAEDSSGNLPGGLLEDSSLYSNNTPATLINDFGGATIDVGQSIAGGIVVATGGTTGNVNSTVIYDSAALGLSIGDKLAVYWFPGRTTAANVLPASNFEIGGFQRTAVNTGIGADAGLVVQTDGTYLTGYFDTTIFPSGGIAPTEFQAVNAVPEPSALLFIGAGILFLLRRQRR